MRRALLPLLALALAPTLAFAQAGGDILWTFQGIEDCWGIAPIEDKDGDFRPDVVVESYDAGAPQTDHLFCLSGASIGVPAVIWSVRPIGGASSGGGYGAFCLSVSPDLNGDGGQDVLLGTAWGGRTAYAIDGDDRTILWSYDTYLETPPFPAASGWVYTATPQADVTGDGVPEVLVPVGSDNNGGYCLNGATGDYHYRVTATDALQSAVSPGDVNGDGYADGAFGGADNEHHVYCISGRWAGPAVGLWAKDLGTSVPSLGVLDDISGDGINDIVAGCWNGAVYGLRSTDGFILWPYSVGGTDVVMQVRVGDDVNGDGHKDVAVASWANAAIVVSGMTGQELWRTPVGTLNGGDVWAIDWVTDVNGDGVDDVIAGSFDLNAYLFDGATGGPLWDTFVNNRCYNARGVGDLNGNGIADAVVGTQKLSSSPGGRAYALEGGQSLVAVEVATLSAVTSASGVALEWSIEGVEEASFHVYRLETSGDRDDAPARKSARAAAVSRGERRSAEVIAAIAAEEPVTYKRLTAEPVTGFGPDFSFTDRTAVAGASYEYRIALVRPGGGERLLPPIAHVTLPVTEARLGAASPNPTSAEAAVAVKLPAGAGAFRVDLFDVAGRWMRTLARGGLGAAARTETVMWDGRDGAGRQAASGIYITRLEAAGHVESGRIVLAR